MKKKLVTDVRDVTQIVLFEIIVALKAVILGGEICRCEVV